MKLSSILAGSRKGMDKMVSTNRVNKLKMAEKTAISSQDRVDELLRTFYKDETKFNKILPELKQKIKETLDASGIKVPSYSPEKMAKLLVSSAITEDDLTFAMNFVQKEGFHSEEYQEFIPQHLRS